MGYYPEVDIVEEVIEDVLDKPRRKKSISKHSAFFAISAVKIFVPTPKITRR